MDMTTPPIQLICRVCGIHFTQPASKRGTKPKDCSQPCRTISRHRMRVAREGKRPGPRDYSTEYGEPLPPNSPLHGTPGGYGYHRCRCGRCREANADRQTAWQNKKRSNRNNG
jgi:hypothetical protein